VFQKIRQPEYHLAVTPVNNQGYLRDCRVCYSQLRERVIGQCKLAYADKADSKLGDVDDSGAKLSYRDNALCNHRPSVSVLERYMKKRKAEELLL
jgi:hypothetical protein